MTILLDNVGADTTSADFISDGGSVVIIVVADDFDIASVALQIASVNDASNRFVTLSNGTFAANGSAFLDRLAIGTKIRAVVSGGGSPLNVFVDVLF